MITLTARHMRIPYAVARKYHPHDDAAYDDLVSVGNVALVEAARTYQSGKGASVETWLYDNVLFAVQKHTNPKCRTSEGRWRRMARRSLDEPLSREPGAGTLADLVADDGRRASLLPPHGCLHEALVEGDLAVAICRHIGVVNCELLKLRLLAGLPYAEIARRANMKLSTLKARLADQVRAIRAWANTRLTPVQRANRRIARQRANSRVNPRIAAQSLRGTLSATRWYVVDHTDRTICGPCGRACPVPESVVLGWPGLTDGAARLLAALADANQAMTRDDLEATTVVADVPRQLGKLRDLGLVEIQGRVPRAGVVGSSKVMYAATAKAISERQPAPPCVAMLGVEAQPLADAGYAVRPQQRGGES